MPAIGVSPEIIELAVALVLTHTVDGAAGVVGDLGDFRQLDKI